MSDQTADHGAADHRGVPAVQRMVEYAPSSGGLALWVGHQDLPDAPFGQPQPGASPGGRSPGWSDTPAGPLKAGDKGAPPAPPPVFTDGHTVFYSPGFASLPLALQTGWVAHQVLHIALRHPQRYLALQQLVGDVDLRLYNLCADAIVNSTLGHLAWLQLPPGALTLEAVLANTLAEQHTPEAALLAWDVESLYRLVDDRRPQPPPLPLGRQQDRDHRPREDQQPAAGNGQREDGPRAARLRAMGQATPPDLVPDPAARGDTPEAEADHAREWRERLLRGHAGDGELSMLRTLLADLPQARTPWEQVLRSQLARGLSQRPGLSWSRPTRSYIANQGRAGPNRRMPWQPGTTASRQVPRLVVVVDVSGSVDGGLLARFAREIESLSRRLEAALVLVIGDDQVRKVQTFAPGQGRLADIVFNGNGGTDFTPLLDEARRHRPDIVVVLTDLQGPAHSRPACPVIWAVPDTLPLPTAPFGRVLALR